jgi:hypothetical protein
MKKPQFPLLPDGSLDWRDLTWMQKLERRIAEGLDSPKKQPARRFD